MEAYSGALLDASVGPVDRPRRRPDYRRDNILSLFDIYAYIRRIKGYRNKAVVLEFTKDWSMFCYECILVDVFKESGIILPIGVDYCTTMLFASELDMPDGMDYHLFKDKFIFKHGPGRACRGDSIVTFIEYAVNNGFIYEDSSLPALMTTTSTGWAGVGAVEEGAGQIILRSTFAMEKD